MSGSSSSKEAFQLKLQEATVDVERLGELFLINREQVSCFEVDLLLLPKLWVWDRISSRCQA